MYISQCFSFSLWISSSGDTYNIKPFKNSNSTFGIKNTRNGKNTSLLQAMLSHSFQFKIKSLIIKIINASKRKLNWRNITGPTDRNVTGKQQQQKTAVFQSISHPLSYKSKFESCKNMPVSAAICASCLCQQCHKQGWIVQQKHQMHHKPTLLFSSFLKQKTPHCISIPRRTTWSLQIKIFTYFFSFQASFPLQFSHRINKKKKKMR